MYFEYNRSKTFEVGTAYLLLRLILMIIIYFTMFLVAPTNYALDRWTIELNLKFFSSIQTC